MVPDGYSMVDCGTLPPASLVISVKSVSLLLLFKTENKRQYLKKRKF